MIGERERYELVFQQFQMPEPAWDRLVGRRDRKRRNQRIAAGVVGIAVFVAAVWIVTSVKSLDRSEPSVPAVSGTTGPAVTGSAVALPNGWHGYGIPPQGTRPSTPVTGTLIKTYPGFHSNRYVYADGRAIWLGRLRDRTGEAIGARHALERRLTPEGVDLVRDGARLEDIPEGAWADAEPRLYVPSRYYLCFWKRGGSLDASTARDMLPPPARDLLSGVALIPSRGCPVVTTALARALDEMLSNAGRSPAPAHGGIDTAWFLSGEGTARVHITPLLPDAQTMTMRG